MTSTTEPPGPDRYVRAADWAKLLAALGLPASAVPADVVAAVNARKLAVDPGQAARDARAAAIRDCRRCDPTGWQLAPDGTAADVARRCDHGAVNHYAPDHGAATARSFSDPLHDRTDTEEQPR